MAGDGAKKKLKVCCGCFWLIGGIVTLAISFHTIAPTEMGLNYSLITQTIDETKLWENGRHMLGPGNRFIIFLKQQQEVRFPGTDTRGNEYSSLTARTIDGLQIDLIVSFQFQLKKKQSELGDLVKLYYDWGENYGNAYAMIARNDLRDEAARWKAYDYFYNRTLIEASMTEVLRQPLLDVAAELVDLQLLDVVLPESFDLALQETEETRQEVVNAKYKMEDVEVKAKNRLGRVNEEADVIRNNYATQAKVISNDMEQAKNTFLAQIESEVNAYKAIQEEVQLTGRNLMNYIWLQSVGTSPQGRFRVDKPSDVKCFSDPRTCAAGPSLNGGEPVDLTFECEVGTECKMIMPGFGLDSKDVIRLAAGVTACENWASTGNGLLDNVQAVESTGNLQKGFRLGTPLGAGTYRVCYCQWSIQVVGCIEDNAFHDSGTLIVS